MEYQVRYKSLDVSHLLNEELEFELAIRKIPFEVNEHDSIKRRKLKDKLKEEKLNSAPIIFQEPLGIVEEELEPIAENIKEITSLLEKSKLHARDKQKLQTRLIHYMHRLDIIRKMRDAEKFVILLTGLDKNLKLLYTRYFTLLSDLPEVRKEVQASIDGKIRQMNKNTKQHTSESEFTAEATSEKSESGRELDRQTVAKETELGAEEKELELEKSTNQDIENRKTKIKQKDFVGRLESLERGEEENWEEMINLFKEFVLDVQQKQELYRKEIKDQERKLQEKKRLEREQTMKSKLEHLIKDMNQKPIKHVKEGKKSNKAQEDIYFVKASSESEREKRKEDGTKRKVVKKLKKRKELIRISSSSGTNTSDSKFGYDSSDNSTDSSNTTTESSSSEDYYRRQKHKNKHKRSHNKRKYQKIRRIAISDWKLRYDGRDNGRGLIEFLKEIKMRCIAEDVNQKELFRSAIHLFSGRAKDWLIDGIENRDFHSWRGLEKRLKREFLPPDIDYQLEVQASSRLQARGEKFGDYYHEIQKIFQSMESQLSSKRKFQIVWRNMRHDYKNALISAKSKIKSLSKLKEYGRLIDENYWHLFQKSTDNQFRRKVNQINEIANFQKPLNKPPVQNVNKTRVFQNSKLIPKSQMQNKNVHKQNTNACAEVVEQKNDEPMEGSSQGTLQALVKNYKRLPIGTCYNCRKIGHHFVECTEKRQQFCKRCGFLNVQTHLCPFCTKNETESA